MIRDYLRALGWYILLVVGGLIVTLTLSSAVGYLPYSDRPGPGWVGPSFSLGQLWYYVSFGGLLLIPTVIYGSALFAYHRLLRYLAAPALLIRIVAALMAGVVAFISVAGTGWFISIAAFPVYVVTVLGAGWGALLLPRHLGPAGLARSSALRWTAIALLVIGGPTALYSMFFSHGYGQTLHLDVVRVTHGSAPAAGVEPRLEPEERALLDSLFPHARLERGITGSFFSGGGDEHQARVLVVVTGPVTSEVRLRVPKGVAAVYVQERDRWRLFPADAPTLNDKITLTPGAGQNEVMFSWPRDGEPSSIKWQEFSAPSSAPVSAESPATVPDQFRGRWAGRQNQCGVPAESRLEIHADTVDFYESRGRVLSVTIVDEREVQVFLELSGEGQTWRKGVHFRLSDDGDSLTDLSTQNHMVRVRCETRS